jgi:U3 small nucleolar RNA-associated protein 13
LDLIWSKSGDDLISCGSDGVVRIWNLQNAQQSETLEAHSERCWAISGKEDLSLIISAGGDGQIVVWEDCTEAVREEEQKKLIEQHLEMQTMKNMMQTKQFKKALEIAVRLGKPGAAMNALKVKNNFDNNEENLESIKNHENLNNF